MASTSSVIAGHAILSASCFSKRESDSSWPVPTSKVFGNRSHARARLHLLGDANRCRGAGLVTRCQAESQSTAGAAETAYEDDDEEDHSAAQEQALQHFLDLATGRWLGNYISFSFAGQPLHSISTEVTGSINGDGEDRSLMQTLRILQAPSKTRVEGEEEETVWRELKLDETNRFTINRRQQLSVFEEGRAFAVSHKTAEVLDRVLRIGVLGADDEDEETPRGVKLPTSRPALVSESCLYAGKGDRRIRAFHVLDPRGLIDTIGVFQERRDNGSGARGKEEGPSEDDAHQGSSDGERLEALLGEWRGVGRIQRSELYGSTAREQESRVVYRQEEDGRITQEVVRIGPGGPDSLVLKGALKGSLLEFEGLQTTLLPGGIALSCPTLVARGQAFAFECSWIHAANTRKRLVRTYDEFGMVVSTALFTETKQQPAP